MVGKMAASQPSYQLIRNLWKVKMKCMFPPPVLWTCGSCTSSLSQLPAGRFDQLIKQKPTLWHSASKLGNTTSRNHRGAVSITWYRLSFSYTHLSLNPMWNMSPLNSICDQCSEICCFKWIKIVYFKPGKQLEWSQESSLFSHNWYYHNEHC